MKWVEMLSGVAVFLNSETFSQKFYETVMLKFELVRSPTIFNIVICWVAGTNDSSTKCLMFQVIFFFTIKIKSFECPKSIRNNEKKYNA